MRKVAVLGAGSWGTALALQLARNEIRVDLWGHLAEDIERMKHDGENSAFLPGFSFPDISGRRRGLSSGRALNLPAA